MTRAGVRRSAAAVVEAARRIERSLGLDRLGD
jgi:hypothetical protein